MKLHHFLDGASERGKGGGGIPRSTFTQALDSDKTYVLTKRAAAWNVDVQ